MPAQGNALGKTDREDVALKGRPIGTRDVFVAPSGLETFSRLPRALPWAVMGQAVGLQAPEFGFDFHLHES